MGSHIEEEIPSMNEAIFQTLKGTEGDSLLEILQGLEKLEMKIRKVRIWLMLVWWGRQNISAKMGFTRDYTELYQPINLDPFEHQMDTVIGFTKLRKLGFEIRKLTAKMLGTLMSKHKLRSSTFKSYLISSLNSGCQINQIKLVGFSGPGRIDELVAPGVGGSVDELDVAVGVVVDAGNNLSFGVVHFWPAVQRCAYATLTVITHFVA